MDPGAAALLLHTLDIAVLLDSLRPLFQLRPILPFKVLGP